MVSDAGVCGTLRVIGANLGDVQSGAGLDAGLIASDPDRVGPSQRVIKIDAGVVSSE